MFSWSNDIIYRKFLKKITIIAQIMALLPVSGVGTVKELKFKWKSLQMIYTFTILTTTIILLLFEIIYSCTSGINNFDSVIMKLTNISFTLFHIRLASKWSKLMKKWSFIDNSMDRRYAPLNNLNLRINIMLQIFIIISLLAYINSLLVFTDGDLFKDFPFFSTFFQYIPYSFPMALYFLLHYTIIYVQSNFNDVFVIVVSTVLALRLKQIRQRLEQNDRHTVFSTEYWLQMRLDYDGLFHLCKEIDNCICPIILISFAYNMYFVIYYLFSQLTGQQSLMSYCLFGCLVLKVFAVCLYTSWVHDEGIGPVNILNSVSGRNYNREIERWLVQLSFDDVVLTGGKMFKITRGIFLNVVSIVVTYELVVMQFRGFSEMF